MAADMRIIKASALLPGDMIDLEPAFRAWPQDDELDELDAGIHWSLFELTGVEATTRRGDVVTIEHDYGVFDVPADFEVEVALDQVSEVSQAYFLRHGRYMTHGEAAEHGPL